MPVSGYYGGHGPGVMRNMMKKYGAKKAKEVFYATANKRKRLSGMAKKAKERMNGK